MKCLVVIPAYNEAGFIGPLLKNLSAVTKEIVVVDDGSHDLTSDIAEKAGVRVIRRPHQGKGAALRTGFQYALNNNYEWIITMDSDGQHDWRDIPNFLAAASRNGTDIVIGTRMADADKMPVVRRFTNRFMSRLLSRVIGQNVLDTQCGFRAISRDVLKNIPLETSHYDTESELLIKAGRAGYRISSIPVKTIYNESKSRINKFTDTIRFIKLMWRLL